VEIYRGTDLPGPSHYHVYCASCIVNCKKHILGSLATTDSAC